MAPDARVTLVLLDGARPDVFDHLVLEGELPNFSRCVLEPGGAVPATTAFPSTTGVAYLPFLTGCYPGTCDVPGIRWLDVGRYGGRWWRNRAYVRSYCGYQGGLINTDLRPGIRTLFDLEPDSVALCTPFTRGLGAGRDRVRFARGFWGAVAHYTGGYGPLERAVGRELARLAMARHRLVFAVFPGIDGVTHFHDPWHPAVLEAYREADRVFGAYARAGGLDGDHLTLLASDHGLSRVERHTDVSLALEGLGVRTLRHPLVWRRDPHAAVMVSGNGSAQVYLKPGERRTRRYTVAEIEAGAVRDVPRELVDYLARLDGVAMVAGQGDGDLTLVSRRGRSRLAPHGAELRYEPDTGDVLRLGAPATLGDREWLVRTLDTAFPDAPVQLHQLFRSARTGDLIVIADLGADLRLDWEIPQHHSGHGSLIADHMRCLVAASQPLDGPVRTVDLFPLMLRHLGVAIPDGIDGVAPALTHQAA